MILPCKHEQKVVNQVEPTIDLLSNLDTSHPEVLRQHAINPDDYKTGLVFRSAIESIRGSFIASSTTGREGLVNDVLENLFHRSLIKKYTHNSSRQRYDFTVLIDDSPEYFMAMEVKGGEGNSINISERPLWAKEFAIWCHLDGAIVNQPSHGAHSILNRITNELVRRQKRVDVLFFKDILCGTHARPCPKYPKHATSIGLKTAPDIFLFPKKIPTLEEPKPPIHALHNLKLPTLILDLFDIDESSQDSHVWEVHIELEQLTDGRLRRIVDVVHQGNVVDTSKSRPWKP
jgi:hypothetical protein